MGRKERQVIAINRRTGERKVFGSSNEAAVEIGVSFTGVYSALLRGGTCKGWELHDMPDMIRDRIIALHNELETLEEEGFK